MEIRACQKLIEAIYYERDSARGLAGTHMWFCEEVGELTRALRRGQADELEATMVKLKQTKVVDVWRAELDELEAALAEYDGRAQGSRPDVNAS